MRITRTWLLALLLGSLAIDCGDRGSKELSQIREAERGIRPFDPATLHDSTRLHVALKFKIVQDSLQLLPDSVSLRPGRMPYHPRQAGGFTVTFRDSTEHELESYTMEDPRIVRSCDFSQGSQGVTTVRSSGQVQILAPADIRIASVVLSSAGGRVQRVPIGDQIKLVVPP